MTLHYTAHPSGSTVKFNYARKENTMSKRWIPEADMRALHAAGVTQSAIMQHYGFQQTEAIRRYERKLGLPPRKPGGRPLGTPSVEEVLNARK